MVGAASRSVLPLVGGSTDYVEQAELPPPDDATALGVFVPAFDAGRVAVGNGSPEAHWVRDDLPARAIAVSDLRGRGEIVVVVAVDLYMVFRNDAEAIRRAVAERLPRHLADRTTVLVPATHNHTGPTPRSTSTTTGTSRYPVGSPTRRPRPCSPCGRRGSGPVLASTGSA